MYPVIGYWKWDDATKAMHRPDGAFVRFVGPETTRSATGFALWMLFEATTSEGRLQLPVQQRLIGRDTNFRALWYRVDFRDCDVPPNHWASAERLISDALACWPRGKLAGGYPTGIGIQGCFIGGAFRPDMFRLYLPAYVGKPLILGSVQGCRGSSQGAWRPELPISRTGETPVAQDDSLCTLRSDHSSVALRAAEYGSIRLEYRDREIWSDRFRCSPPYRDQHWLWSIGSSTGEVEILGQSAEAFESMSWAAKRSTGEARTRLLSEENSRALASFHEALFALSPGSVMTDRLRSPPTIVKSAAPWTRAGYLSLDCVTATELIGPELQAAFMDEPNEEDVFSSPAGSAFDAAHGVLQAPDGTSLAFESIEETLGLTPVRIRLRCRTASLDWPIVIHRLDRRPGTLASFDFGPQLISRWHIDHAECLEAWRREGHSGLPAAETWDVMRQFIEEAILAWGDSPACGPAPQSLSTSGGWYDGRWRGGELRRLLSRPDWINNIARTDVWEPYTPVTHWHRIDATLIGHPDPPPPRHSPPDDPPIPFDKISIDGSQRLSASGFVVKSYRDEYMRRFLVDYHGCGDDVRLGGTRSRMATAGIVRVQEPASAEQTPARLPWPAASLIEAPGLSLWRRLRDASESGLRKGETAKVIGGYLFDRLYGQSIRITALSAEIEDFDCHFIEAGDDLS